MSMMFYKDFFQLAKMFYKTWIESLKKPKKKTLRLEFGSLAYARASRLLQFSSTGVNLDFAFVLNY